MRLLRRLAILTTATLMLTACQSDTSDSFISEYEGLNGVVSEGGEYMEVSIPEDHRFLPATEEQVRELLDDGDGAIYFGFPECPWCRNAVSPLTEAAAAVNLDQIHYVNVSEIRDQKSVDDDGEVVTEEEGTDYYEFLLDELGDHAPEYPGMEGSGERRILVPLVAVVVDGEVVSNHLGTVESQTDPSIPLDGLQRQELIGIYSAMFEEIPGCGPTYCE
ncbi:hypothetical protein [Flaviflexus massiliensis]|uniref:hypothetical protein n=1 Tax=Flaviflexus massiliensis TaxID=1522309 RepID=UPI0006D57FB8|nr:hypothetical protein [Flaviflexus massiliensis]